MIEFVTLLMGLVTGPQTVVLAVHAPAAVVELRLDGRLAGRRTLAPWRFAVDLGEALAPHELVAIARDARGGELARARHWVNLDLPPAAAEGESPAEVIVVQQPGTGPVLDEMARVFLGEELRRLGLPGEPPPADSSAWDPALLRLPREAFEQAVRQVFQVPRGVEVGRQSGALWRAYQAVGDLGGETRVRFLSPIAVPVSHSAESRHLFAASTGVADVGLLWLTKNVRPLGFIHRIADAVAIAGREVHATGRRRAVILLLGAEAGDGSLYSVAAVRGYLRDLRVPLFVWTLSAATATTPWVPASFIGVERSGRGGSSTARDVGAAFDRLERAAAEVRSELEGQLAPTDGAR
jgi:hypothetical protein